MWKKSLLTLLVLSPFVWAEQPEPQAEKTYTEQEVSELKTQWLADSNAQQQQHLQQRENFLQAESLLSAAIKNKKVSETTFNLARSLFAENYPLQEESQWLLLRAKIAMANAENVGDLVQEIRTFAEKYPNTARRNKLDQLPFSLFAQFGKSAELLQYSSEITPNSIENQCRVYDLKLAQIQPKLNGEQADAAQIEKEKLLQEFDQFWQNASAELPSECGNIFTEWHKSDFDNERKTKLKAVTLVKANAKTLLAKQVENQTNPELKSWLENVANLLNNPADWQIFAEKQPLDQANKAILLQLFPAFIRTQPEKIDQTHWSICQSLAEKFELSDDEIRQWKISFLSRAFDNDDRMFQTWRDQQLIDLKADNLTERRLRTAIFERADLKAWFALLSPDAQNKQEWRYWAAKQSEKKAELLTALSQERGFYPMLAAHELGKNYQFTQPISPTLTTEQQAKFQAELDRIQELRTLNRLDRAKLAWVDLMQEVNFEEKLALTHYAHSQNWVDLAVEGTIQAKAWDYLDLRLPNAYSDWFDLHLQGKKISKSFAMAIARQESAWNASAKSHANAIGLMQMLPSTAKQTADNSDFPFAENDLLQPFRNIMLGTTHLEELNTKYPNNRILMAAAYNAGSHRVTRWLNRANGKLKMDEFIASIPFLETRGYVQNVLAYDFYYQMLQGKKELVMFSKEEQIKY